MLVRAAVLAEGAELEILVVNERLVLVDAADGAREWVVGLQRCGPLLPPADVTPKLAVDVGIAALADVESIATVPAVDVIGEVDARQRAPLTGVISISRCGQVAGAVRVVVVGARGETTPYPPLALRRVEHVERSDECARGVASRRVREPAKSTARSRRVSARQIVRVRRDTRCEWFVVTSPRLWRFGCGCLGGRLEVSRVCRELVRSRSDLERDWVSTG